MSPNSFIFPYFIILHFCSCLATSDPNLYSNKSKKIEDDGRKEFASLALSDIVRGPYQMAHLTAEDYKNAITVDGNQDDASIWIAPRQTVDLFEGDISGIQSMQELRNAIVGRHYRWPNGVIPYVLSTAFTLAERSIIARAVIEYHNKTCIRFVPRTNQPDFIVFKTTGSGCNSNVGRVGGAQTVSLDQGCIHVGLIIHELMHAAGFYHEQARMDRDDYVVINWPNIQDGMQRNFDKLGINEIELLETRYDTGSVMHYDQFAFAKDRKIPTIYSKTGSTLGNTQGFSQNDIVKLNIMYQCGSDELATTDKTTAPATQSTVSATQSTTTEVATTTVHVTTAKEVSEPAGTTGTSRTTESKATTEFPPKAMTTSKIPTGPECADIIEGCHVWARDGFCNFSVHLMTAFCRKTCGFCSGTNEAKFCVDRFPTCVQFANMRQCGSDFMVHNCPKSCNACNKP